MGEDRPHKAGNIKIAIFSVTAFPSSNFLQKVNILQTNQAFVQISAKKIELI